MQINARVSDEQISQAAVQLKRGRTAKIRGSEVETPDFNLKALPALQHHLSIVSLRTFPAFSN
jgi:hypothetical protein